MTKRETVTAHHYRYTALFERDEDGGYVVICPALPGLVTEGDTIEEARAMAADAIRCYLGSLRKSGLPFPVDDYLPLGEKVEVIDDAV
jgi:antitoxin HicB